MGFKGTQIDEPSYQELVTFLAQKQLSNWLTVALPTLLFYDYFVTFEQEVKYVWRRKFTGATAVFFVNRYCMLIYTVIFSVNSLFTVTDAVCRGLELTTNIISGCISIALAFFASLRIFAIWGRNYPLSVLVLVLYVGAWVLKACWVFRSQDLTIPTFKGCFVVYEKLYTQRMHNLSLQPTKHTEFCAVSQASDAIIMSADALMLILTWVKTANIRKDALAAKVRVPVSRLLLRDGTLHFLIFFIFSVLDVAFVTDPSLILSVYVNPFIGPLRSIVASHFILSLRQVFLAEDPDNLPSLHVSTVRFAGNFGAPLRMAGDERREFVDEEHIADGEQQQTWNSPLAAGLLLPYTYAAGDQEVELATSLDSEKNFEQGSGDGGSDLEAAMSSTHDPLSGYAHTESATNSPTTTAGEVSEVSSGAIVTVSRTRE